MELVVVMNRIARIARGLEHRRDRAASRHRAARRLAKAVVAAAILMVSGQMLAGCTKLFGSRHEIPPELRQADAEYTAECQRREPVRARLPDGRRDLIAFLRSVACHPHGSERVRAELRAIFGPRSSREAVAHALAGYGIPCVPSHLQANTLICSRTLAVGGAGSPMVAKWDILPRYDDGDRVQDYVVDLYVSPFRDEYPDLEQQGPQAARQKAGRNKGWPLAGSTVGGAQSRGCGGGVR